MCNEVSQCVVLLLSKPTVPKKVINYAQQLMVTESSFCPDKLCQASFEFELVTLRAWRATQSSLETIVLVSSKSVLVLYLLTAQIDGSSVELL